MISCRFWSVGNKRDQKNLSVPHCTGVCHGGLCRAVGRGWAGRGGVEALCHGLRAIRSASTTKEVHGACINFWPKSLGHLHRSAFGAPATSPVAATIFLDN